MDITVPPAVDLLGDAMPLDPWGKPMEDPAVSWVVYLPGHLAEGCPTSLTSWACFLAGNRAALAKQGDTFRAKCFAIRYESATLLLDRWLVPPCPPGHAYHAVTDEVGGPWWDDDMVGSAEDAAAMLDERGGVIVFRELVEHDLWLRFDWPDASDPATARLTPIPRPAFADGVV